jgi:hypothetical protein
MQLTENMGIQARWLFSVDYRVLKLDCVTGSLQLENFRRDILSFVIRMSSEEKISISGMNILIIILSSVLKHQSF